MVTSTLVLACVANMACAVSVCAPWTIAVVLSVRSHPALIDPSLLHHTPGNELQSPGAVSPMFADWPLTVTHIAGPLLLLMAQPLTLYHPEMISPSCGALITTCCPNAATQPNTPAISDFISPSHYPQMATEARTVWYRRSSHESSRPMRAGRIAGPRS